MKENTQAEPDSRSLSGRERQIVDYLKEHNLVTVEELVDVTGVSAATVRRDLIRLSESGTVYRVHGGVTLNRLRPSQPTTIEKASRHHEEKLAIARAAASLVRPGDSVIFDAGTTTIEIARLCRDLQLQVITPDLHIGLLLADRQNIEVALTGGIVDWSSQSCIGVQAVDVLSRLHPNLVFLSCNAFSLEDGITAPTPDKARVKGSLLSMRSPFKVLVADSSKYGLTQLFEVGRLSDLDLILTDSRLSQDALQAMERAGLKVICTSRDTETDLSSLRLR